MKPASRSKWEANRCPPKHLKQILTCLAIEAERAVHKALRLVSQGLRRERYLKKAEASGQNLREWAREVLLRNAKEGSQSDMEMHIFTELVGIQMLLMNTLEPLLRGDKLAQEQLAILFRRVQTTKAAQAQEVLAKRSQNKEK